MATNVKLGVLQANLMSLNCAPLLESVFIVAVMRQMNIRMLPISRITESYRKQTLKEDQDSRYMRRHCLTIKDRNVVKLQQRDEKVTS